MQVRYPPHPSGQLPGCLPAKPGHEEKYTITPDRREEIYRMSLHHCTQKEIADIIQIPEYALMHHCRDEVERGRSMGKASLRRMQWEAAEKGAVVMLIWLGKQLLGQKDRQPEEATQVHFNVKTNDVPVDNTPYIEVAKQAISDANASVKGKNPNLKNTYLRKPRTKPSARKPKQKMEA